MDVVLFITMTLGLGFAFFNGFHDAGVITGNSVFTRSLGPRQALVLAAAFNFVGALVGQGIVLAVTQSLLSLPHSGDEILLVIAAALFAGVVINIATYLLGLPIASTHTLFGGLAGAGFMLGFHMDDGPTVIFSQDLFYLLISPFLAMAVAAALTVAISRLFASSAPKPLYRKCRQIDSILVAALSLTHGSQDAQKVGAVLAIAWAARFHGQETVVPVDRPWIIIIAVAAALSVGTLCSGWRVARTVSQRLVHLNPVRATISDGTSVTFLSFAAFMFQLPMSMSFIVVGANLGSQVGAGKNAVNLRVLGRVIGGFILGVPVTAVLAATTVVPFMSAV